MIGDEDDMVAAALNLPDLLAKESHNRLRLRGEDELVFKFDVVLLLLKREVRRQFRKN